MSKTLETCTCGNCTPRGSTRGTPAKHVTVEQATAMVRATCEQLTAMGFATAAEPERAVVGMYLTPRDPDGAGGKIVKAVRIGPKQARQYVPIAKQDALRAAPDHAPGSIPPGPTSPDELTALKAEAAKLKTAIANPATGAVDRTRMAQRLDAVRSRIEQIETAVHPETDVGQPPTAGARQYAATSPYFQLSDARRAEHEAQVAALKAQIAAPGLLPVHKIRLEQELQHLEHLLQMDASTSPDPRPYQERRAAG